LRYSGYEQLARPQLAAAEIAKLLGGREPLNSMVAGGPTRVNRDRPDFIV
jgi:hypothetical protein